MKHLLALVLMVFSFVSSAQAQQQSDFSVTRGYVSLILTSKARDGIVRPEFAGSAVIIDPKFALTAAHVLKDPALGSVAEMTRGGRKIKFQVVATNAESDLALIKGEFECPCAPLATKEPVVDQIVYAVGYTHYFLYHLQMLTEGIVQGSSSTVDNTVVATTHVGPGASGGGVFVKQDGQYQLVGIITMVGAVHIGPRALNLEQELSWLTFMRSLTTIQQFLEKTNYKEFINQN